MHLKALLLLSSRKCLLILLGATISVCFFYFAYYSTSVSLSLQTLFAGSINERLKEWKTARLSGIGNTSASLPLQTLFTGSIKERLEQWKTARLSGIGSANEVQRVREKFFIMDPEYEIRTQLLYFHDFKVSLYQPVTYYVAAELARRYKVKHIIDVGCGKSYKLAKLYPHFIPIGIDFLDNVKYSREHYPHLRFLEINMEGGVNKSDSCHVNIEDSVVEDSVVVTADVIEHISDPVSCYMKLLRDFARRSKAVVLSTPDREVIYPPDHHGPPGNPHHIREHKLNELEFMMIDNGLFPVIGGRGCSLYLYCNYTSFLPDTHKMGNAILTMRNSRIGEQLVTGLVPDVSGKFLAFVVLRKSVKASLAVENVIHLFGQGVNKVFILIGHAVYGINPIYSSLSSYLSQGSVKIIQLQDNEETLTSVIAKTPTASDWSILTDANEFVQPTRDASMGNQTLRNLIALAQLEKFNSVAVTTVFIGCSTKNKTSIKIYGEGAWNKDNNLTYVRHGDVLRNRIRIWRGNPQLVLETVHTKMGYSASTGVKFTQMAVYPYGAYGERVSPEKLMSDSLLQEERMQQLFAYHLSLQFMLSDGQPFLQKTLYDY